MTRGPVRLDVAVSYALPRAGLPSAVSFRKWVAAALKGANLVQPVGHYPQNGQQHLVIVSALWKSIDDIGNTRRISRVYLRGEEVDRAALKASP